MLMAILYEIVLMMRVKVPKAKMEYKGRMCWQLEAKLHLQSLL